MKYLFLPVVLAGAIVSHAAGPALTIHNENFAVVREAITLDLQPGMNSIGFSDITSKLEPSSVILRDRAGKVPLRILEQNYRNDPVSESLMLLLNEGKMIDFEVVRGDVIRVIPGKILRSGHVPRFVAENHAFRYSDAYQYSGTPGNPIGGTPVIELEGGRLVFGLPGKPIFPPLGDDSILKPTLNWKIQSDVPVKLDAELGYITAGLSWAADYNVVAEENGDKAEFTGWVTIQNQSGRTFANAQLHLMAGDMARVQAKDGGNSLGRRNSQVVEPPNALKNVFSQNFDEYHLYTINPPTTLRDQETKQVEFIRAEAARSQRIYIYDGAKFDSSRFQGWPLDSLRQNPEYGTDSNTKIWVMREFQNSKDDGLGMPLPKGRMRFYRRGENDRFEFVGENLIDHTAANETLRIYTGNAFDLTGERRRINFKMEAGNASKESFELKLRNQKLEPVEIRVVEHLYRATQWEIIEKSNMFLKTDAQTIEFRVGVPPGGEKTVTYTVHYRW